MKSSDSVEDPVSVDDTCSVRDTLSVAILRTDEVMPQFIESHGDYPAMFTALLERAARERPSPLKLRVDSFDARMAEFPAPEEYEGYVITGSRLSVYDDESWIAELADYLDTVLAAGRKIVGICFGHQLMAHFFGGETAPAQAGWGVGVQKSRAVVAESWMDPPGARLNLLASHKDQVSRLPEGARVIASSEFCPVGGFVMGDQVLTLQGHPEFHKGYSRDLMNMRRELLGESTFEAGVESLGEETDEAKVGHWMLNFMTGESCGG